MESQETKFEAPMPSRAEIMATAPESPFGHANVIPAKNGSSQTVAGAEVNVEFDSSGNILAGTCAKIIEHITSHKKMPKKPNTTGHETTEEYETRCFLNIYKDLKDDRGGALSTDQLLLLLQHRFNLPKSIEENAEFKEQLDKGNVCYGEFNRRYNKQYVQPIKQRVLRVLAHWVRDDPFNEMKQPIGGGTLLYRRIRSWAEKTQENMLGLSDDSDSGSEQQHAASQQVYTSPFVKSAMRHLMLELDKVAESEQTELRYNPSPCEPEPESLWHLTRDKNDFSLVTLHPMEVARQITLITHYKIKDSPLDHLRLKESSTNTELIAFVDTTVFYLRAALVTTKSLNERKVMLERICEMVVQFEIDKNYFLVELIVDHVIFWSELRRLGQTHDAPFENVKLKGILHDLHERQECLARSDATIQSWLLDKPYLWSFTGFKLKISQAKEQEKTFATYATRKNLKHLNMWSYKLIQGNYFSLFKAGTRLNYNYKPIDAIQEWLTNWDPRSFFGDETLNLHITAHREQLSLMIEEAANELIQNEGEQVQSRYTKEELNKRPEKLTDNYNRYDGKRKRSKKGDPTPIRANQPGPAIPPKRGDPEADTKFFPRISFPDPGPPIPPRDPPRPPRSSSGTGSRSLGSSTTMTTIIPPPRPTQPKPVLHGGSPPPLPPRDRPPPRPSRISFQQTPLLPPHSAFDNQATPLTASTYCSSTDEQSFQFP